MINPNDSAHNVGQQKYDGSFPKTGLDGNARNVAILAPSSSKMAKLLNKSKKTIKKTLTKRKKHKQYLKKQKRIGSKVIDYDCNNH